MGCAGGRDRLSVCLCVQERFSQLWREGRLVVEDPNTLDLINNKTSFRELLLAYTTRMKKVGETGGRQAGRKPAGPPLPNSRPLLSCPGLGSSRVVLGALTAEKALLVLRSCRVRAGGCWCVCAGVASD